MIKESQYIDVARGFVNLLRAFSFLFLGWIKEIKNKERDPVIKKQLQAVLIKVYEMKNRDAFLSSIKQLDARGVFLARTLLATSALTILLDEDLLKDLKDEKISESFLHLIGMLVLYEAELLLRARAGEIDLNDDEFRFAYLFPYPNPYILFYYTSKKIEFEGIAKASLHAVQKLAEIATKGIYHPDDPKWTKNKKFLSERKKEVEEPKAKVQKTEAEGLFDELLAVTLHKKLSAFDEKELGEKIFEWDKNLLNLPNSYRRDLYNEIESDLVRRGAKRETLRELNEEIKKLWTLVNEDEDYQKDLQQAEQELTYLITKHIGVVHTGQEDFEGIPTEIEISNDMVHTFMHMHALTKLLNLFRKENMLTMRCEA
ncbi:MAG: hypothetical protein ACM3SR_14615 [Ignavibacteriales bacterium]